MNKPPGHTLYWAYAYNEKETEYNFDTDTTLRGIKQKAQSLIVDDGFHHGYIFYGDEDGAFTQYDPVMHFGADA